MDAGNIANSGMKAALAGMGTIGNNIANGNTTGFKSGTMEFSDVYALGANNINEGVGVRVSGVKQNFSSGGIELTDRGLDLCIGKEGFFVLRNPADNQVSYTRAGRMDLDPSGYLLGVGGARLQGYPVINGTLVTSGKLTDLQIPSASLPANATTLIQLNINLDSSAIPPVNAFNSTDPTTYNNSTNTLIYDSLGNSYAASVYYVKTAANTWTANVEVNGVAAGSGTLNFSSNGTLLSSTGLNNLSFAPTSGATSPQNFEVSLAGSSEFGGFYKTNHIIQDGYSAGNQNGYSINDSGKIFVKYTNDQSVIAGQIALANFTALEGLEPVGNMSWVDTAQSGPALIADSNSLNNIQAGALELSNTDLTGSMVALMQQQYGFQANAHASQINNEVMKTITNL